MQLFTINGFCMSFLKVFFSIIFGLFLFVSCSENTNEISKKTEQKKDEILKVPPEIIGKWKNIDESAKVKEFVISKEQFANCLWFKQPTQQNKKIEGCVSEIVSHETETFQDNRLMESVHRAFYKQMQSLEQQMSNPSDELKLVDAKLADLFYIIKRRSEYENLIKTESPGSKYWTILSTNYENNNGKIEVSEGSGDCSYYDYITERRLYIIQDCLIHSAGFNISVYEKE